MAYYLRAFCRNDDVPALNAVFEDAAARGIALELDPEPPVFIDRCAGLVQADGEGFYDGDRLIVEVD